VKRIKGLSGYSLAATIVVLAGFVFVLTGCRGSGGGGGDNGEISGFYIAGYYDNGSRKIACYWEDGTKIDLTDPGTAAEAHGIFVSGGSVYVAGFYDDGSRNVACYWKDGAIVELTVAETEPAEAYGIYVSGSDVYVAGWLDIVVGAPTQPRAHYWKNNSGGKTALSDSGNESKAYGIYVSGSVYTAGYDDDGDQEAVYWIGTALQPALTSAANNEWASGVFVSGGNAYISGRYVSGTPNAVYWINTTQQPDLPHGGLASWATSIFLSDGSVYVTGDYNDGTNRPAYWKDGAKTDLPFTGDGFTQSISVAYGDVYVAGYEGSGAVKDAVYWKNESKTNLSAAIAGDARAFSIFVAP
jgi:hypothetical protein